MRQLSALAAAGLVSFAENELGDIEKRWSRDFSWMYVWMSVISASVSTSRESSSI